jgi:hypothetical protein
VRRITFLEKIPEADGSPHFRIAVWCDVPAARQAWFVKGPLPLYAALESQIDDGSVSAQDQANLAAGAIIEYVLDYRFDSSRTVNQIQTEMVNVYNRLQAQTNSWNPWVRYGSIYDDATGWAANGVA